MNQLSIITINYNNASGLRKTIESVLSQSSSDFEYIVVNCKSSKPHFKSKLTDDEEVLRPYIKNELSTENGFTRCIWNLNNIDFRGGFFSEPDNGIYNAMNKGINVANGKYIHFLNSGDWLVDSFVVDKMLKELNSLLNSEEKPDIFVGRKIAVRPDGKVRRCKNDTQPVTLYTFYRGTIEHTSAYIRRSLFNEYGIYDQSLKIVSDWKWYLIAIGLGRAKVSFTDCYVSYFDTTGISSTNKELEMKERRQVLEELLPKGVLLDYDNFYLDIVQMERLKRYPAIYKLVWLIERILFKFDKWKAQYRDWKTNK